MLLVANSQKGLPEVDVLDDDAAEAAKYAALVTKNHRYKILNVLDNVGWKSKLSSWKINCLKQRKKLCLSNESWSWYDSTRVLF